MPEDRSKVIPTTKRNELALIHPVNSKQYAIIPTEASLDDRISRYITFILSEADVLDALGY